MASPGYCSRASPASISLRSLSIRRSERLGIKIAPGDRLELLAQQPPMFAKLFDRLAISELNVGVND
jgi:hypothetical protein